MKASRIALALGALASISAWVANAQGVLSYSKDGANVQIYGDIDYYLSYMTSSSGSKSISLQDGAYLRTRLGLKGDKRSEEHTSELQSPCNLVCRLLLEKKRNQHPA